MKTDYIIIENEKFCLKISENAVAESLVIKATGEECLDISETLPMFSLTEERPYNNEIKLAHPNKKITFLANRIRREGEMLFVGFELITFEAVIKITERAGYIAFELADFNIPPKSFGTLCMTPPPVLEFRLLQLPIKNRKHFGEWLNVAWDQKGAVNVLATSPYAKIDSFKRKDCRILSADALQDVKLKGCGAALIACEKNELLDIVEAVENDFDLPKGVKNRRKDELNASVYWVGNLYPSTVDMHIENAKKGGFRMMLVYYSAIVNETDVYALCGNYDFRPEYPNGFDDLKAVLAKIKAAGITPGIHFLHTHIGKCSRYVTPVADHRLNLKRHFTLSKPLGTEDNVIYVEENPEGSVMHERCRILKFGGELISYESFTTEYPYCFKGCSRGHWNTNVTEHELGQIGGLLDVSEFSAKSVYLNQNSSLQEEIAEKIANIYNCGFEFAYFDGSEGTNPPFEFHVANAQYRVYKRFNKEPLFCEGAAKSHFSWHMLSGGNAFDIFPSETFKEMTAKHPLEEAGRMADDFTRVDFGWWRYFPDAQPDLYEYATSRAASWDCPATLQARSDLFPKNPRNDDVFEVIRRWEDIRAKKLLTKEQKEALKNPSQEHILLINEKGEYELTPYYEVKSAAKGNELVKAYVFERKGKSYAVCWHKTDCGKLVLPIKNNGLLYEKEIGGATLPIETIGEQSGIIIENRSYLSTELSLQELKTAFENAVLK